MSVHRNNIIRTGNSVYDEWNNRSVEDFLLYHGLNPDKVSEKDGLAVVKRNNWSVLKKGK